MCVGEFAVDGLSPEDLTPPDTASQSIQGPFVGENNALYLTPVKSTPAGSSTFSRTIGNTVDSAFVTPEVKVKFEKSKVSKSFLKLPIITF